MINQCKKGKRVELELVHFLKENGIVSARRTAQHCGKFGDSDVIAPDELPSFHIESKGTVNNVIPKSTLKKWATQLRVDCPVGKIPILFHKANNEDWVGITLHPHRKLLQIDSFDRTIFTGDSVCFACAFKEFSKTVNVYDLLEFNYHSLDTYEVIYLVDSETAIIALNAKSLIKRLLSYENRNKIPA